MKVYGDLAFEFRLEERERLISCPFAKRGERRRGIGWATVVEVWEGILSMVVLLGISGNGISEGRVLLFIVEVRRERICGGFPMMWQADCGWLVRLN